MRKTTFSSQFFPITFITVLYVVHAVHSLSCAARLLVTKCLMNLGQKLPWELKPAVARSGFGPLHPECSLVLMETNAIRRCIPAIALDMMNRVLTHRKP